MAPTIETLTRQLRELEEELAGQRRFKTINRILLTIAKAVNTTDNLDELFQTIHHALGTILDSTNFYIALYEATDDSLTFPYIVDSVDINYPPVIEVSRTASLTAEVIRERKALLVTKEEILSRRATGSLRVPKCTPAEIWLGVPLLTQESLVGVMAVQSYLDPNCYSHADLEVMLSVADLVALSIERKRRERALKEQHRRLENIIEATQVGTWEWDLPSGIIIVNDRWAEMLGYNLAELAPTGQIDCNTWNGLLHPDDLAANTELLARHFAGEIAYYHNEYRMRHKAGHWHWLLVRGRVVSRDAAGQPLLMLGTQSDISDRKKNESEQKKLQEQLAKIQKLESVGQLAGGIAHNFNNMLAVILGYMELVLQEVDEEQPIHAALRGIQEAAERSADLTRQLLAFARRQTVAPKVIDLNQTLAEMLDLLRQFSGEGVDLQWRPGLGLGEVKIDPAQFQQLLVTLTVNARDSLSGGGRIIIETSNVRVDERYRASYPYAVSGDYVRLSVSDNGSGMDAKTVSRLFEPFFSTKEPGKGTGLGLATVYGIVKQNNGFVNVYSEPGHGSSFTFHLPRVGHDPDQLPAAGSTALTERRGAKTTILLVDDEATILSTIKELLEEVGYQVLAAAGPQEAIDLAASAAEVPALLLTDVIMPGMNGGELAKTLAASYPEMACLFMSGYTANVTVRHGLLTAGVNFIQKPFSQRELLVMIKAILTDTAGE